MLLADCQILHFVMCCDTRKEVMMDVLLDQSVNNMKLHKIPVWLLQPHKSFPPKGCQIVFL